jgi:snapalysin
MFVKKVLATVAVAVAISAGLVGTHTARASAAVTPKIVYYTSSATRWQKELATAVANWNSSVTNVQLRAGRPATVTIQQDEGWPRTMSARPGTGTVYLGQLAVTEGYDKTRIAAHELGHILGLPDNRTGNCADLMSGHSAATSCTVAWPSSAEARQVQCTFGPCVAPKLPARIVDFAPTSS